MTEDQPPDLLPIKGHFTDLFAARKIKPRWIIPDVITTGLTLIIGPAKDAFKTTLEMAFALLIARKSHAVLPREWVPVMHGPALIFEDEAEAGELREMVEDGMGCKEDPDETILVADRPEEWRLDDEFATQQMIEWIEERGVRTVGIGPLANFHTTDEKDATAVINLLRPLRRYAKRNDLGLFITHHTRKIEEGKTYTENDARGSGALFGLCDNILVITPGKEPYELLVRRKGKKGKAWEKVFFLNVWDRLGKTTSEPLRAVDKMIIKALLQGFTTLAKVSEQTGLNEKTIGGRLADLTACGVLKRSGQGQTAKYSTILKYKPEDLK